MTKGTLFLGLILLTGCSFFRPNEEEIIMTTEPESTPVQTVIEPVSDPFLTPTLPPVMEISTPTDTAEQKPIDAVSVSDDGRVLELPAQKIYLDPDTMTLTLPDSDKVQPISSADSVWFPANRPTDAEFPRVPRAVITLQDTADRNHYAQCLATNLDCIKIYEGRGYRRIQGLPHFAGYRDIPLSSDYPTGGRWRNNNNIPRW